MIVLWMLVYLMIIGGFFYLVAKVISGVFGLGKQVKGPREVSDKDFVTGVVSVSAGFTGLVALNEIPAAFGDDEEAARFITQIVIAIILLMVGYAVKQQTGRLLMILGVIMLVIASFSIFDNFGDVGALIVVAIGFAVLVYLAVRQSSKKGAQT